MSPNISFRTPRTDRDWFLYYLFNDAEFVKSKKKIINSLKEEFGEAYSVIIMLRDKSYFDNILRNSKASKQIDKLANKFEVSRNVIEDGLEYIIQLPVNRSSQPHVTINDDGTLSINITPNTRLRDVKAIWHIVNKKQKETKKRIPQSKNSYNPKLIHALYKQRLKGADNKRKSWEKIFRDYQDGLIGYKGSTIQYKSSDSLERFYLRHKPKTDSF